eukprot:TRINITY_DN1662_c0_g1_i1.p1 TRINITY_DN1662_c0_g1~~TRINITY_DN1662_c0_g1_i1.p1  ORF type:complete len:166 (-),score=79.76 TRINITY_DN1662_c0_g1_i1:248-745(-)
MGSASSSSSSFSFSSASSPSSSSSSSLSVSSSSSSSTTISSSSSSTTAAAIAPSICNVKYVCIGSMCNYYLQFYENGKMDYTKLDNRMESGTWEAKEWKHTTYHPANPLLMGGGGPDKTKPLTLSGSIVAKVGRQHFYIVIQTRGLDVYQFSDDSYSLAAYTVES